MLYSKAIYPRIRYNLRPVFSINLKTYVFQILSNLINQGWSVNYWLLAYFSQISQVFGKWCKTIPEKELIISYQNFRHLKLENPYNFKVLKKCTTSKIHTTFQLNQQQIISTQESNLHKWHLWESQTKFIMITIFIYTISVIMSALE